MAACSGGCRIGTLFQDLVASIKTERRIGMKRRAVVLSRLLLIALFLAVAATGAWACSALSTDEMQKVYGGCYPTYPCKQTLPCDVSGLWGCTTVGQCPTSCTGSGTTTTCDKALGSLQGSCTPGAGVPGGCGQKYMTVACISGRCSWSNPNGTCDKGTATGSPVCPAP